MLITWNAAQTLAHVEPPWLLNPYVVEEGITFLWGKSSIGKSPVMWEMAKCIGEGSPFFGMPSRKARVLILEVDSPSLSVIPRIKKKPPTENVWFQFMNPLSVPDVRHEDKEALLRAKEVASPEVVFINTTRKVHRMDDKDSRTPSIVFGWFKELFPTSALVFVHHERKTGTDLKNSRRVNKESFSGSYAFLGDCQVGLQLREVKGTSPQGSHNLKLFHYKSQVSQKVNPLHLILAPDGSTLSAPDFEKQDAAWQFVKGVDRNLVTGQQLDIDLGHHLGMSPSSARLLRMEIDAGNYPGSPRWLGVSKRK